MIDREKEIVWEQIQENKRSEEQEKKDKEEKQCKKD